MAINKSITLDNGVVMNYHRVVSVNNITNKASIIEVCSYLNEEQRDKEIAYQELQQKNIDGTIIKSEYDELMKGLNIITHSTFLNIEYNENLNVKNAYEYIKDLDNFKGSKDV